MSSQGCHMRTLKNYEDLSCEKGDPGSNFQNSGFDRFSF